MIIFLNRCFLISQAPHYLDFKSLILDSAVHSIQILDIPVADSDSFFSFDRVSGEESLKTQLQWLANMSSPNPTILSNAFEHVFSKFSNALDRFLTRLSSLRTGSLVQHLELLNQSLDCFNSQIIAFEDLVRRSVQRYPAFPAREFLDKLSIPLTWNTEAALNHRIQKLDQFLIPICLDKIEYLDAELLQEFYRCFVLSLNVIPNMSQSSMQVLYQSISYYLDDIDDG